MKVPKVTRGHRNGFLRAAAVNNFLALFAVTVGNPFMWPLAAFENPSIATVTAYRKIRRSIFKYLRNYPYDGQRLKKQ